MAESNPAIRVTEARDETQQPRHATTYSPADDSDISRPNSSDTRPSYSSPIEGNTSPRAAYRKTVASPYGALAQDVGHLGTPLRASTSPSSTNLGLDPLSQYINRRTSILTPPTLPRTTSDGTTTKLSPVASRDTAPSLKLSPSHTSPNEEPVFGPKIKKGVKFLGRMIGKKKDFADIVEDAVSERAEERPEGAEASVFCSLHDNSSYNPRHAQPPAYIKVRSSGKKEKDFNRMFLAQELQEDVPASQGLNRAASNSSQPKKLRRKRKVDDGAIWATAFSNDGKFLAAGGQDKVVRVWAVLSSPDERQQHERDEDVEVGGESTRLNAPVFRQKTVQVFEGHTGPILDLCWSKNNFLISTSMDKTVKLWHISRTECLCTFKHSDVVTSVRFHPKDDRFFLAGSLDSKLRLWSIPDKNVAYWVTVSDMITAVAFTPDGKQAIAGTLSGHCLFYDTESLKYSTSIHVRSSHGKNAKGSKITGIQTIMVPPESSNGDVKLLITSNDSRIRLYNLRDKSLEQKFRGATNSSSQIQARFSSDAQYIICGSEDGKVFIWSVDWLEREARLLEFFEAHNVATTVTAFAPMTARQRLGGSGDPVYDLCNPPNVMLQSTTEEGAESLRSWRPGDDAARLKRSPSTSSGANGSTHSLIRPAGNRSPSYLTRAMHRAGNIIVTASSDGVIKVFRQDCAWRQRQRALETASIFSKRLNRRSSLANSFRSRKDSSTTLNTGDRINNWRQTIQGSGKSSLDKTRPSSLLNGRTGSMRSISPIHEHVPEKMHKFAAPMAFNGPMKSSTWPIVRHDDEAAPLPSPAAQGHLPTKTDQKKENVPLVPRRTPPQQHTVSSSTSADEDFSDDETFDSADEEPQPQSSPIQTTEAKVSSRASGYSPSKAPQNIRGNSAAYWAQDAWRDQVTQQVGSAVQRMQEERGAASLRPGVSRQHSGISDVSVLTSEANTTSDGGSRPGTRGGR